MRTQVKIQIQLFIFNFCLFTLIKSYLKIRLLLDCFWKSKNLYLEKKDQHLISSSYVKKVKMQKQQSDRNFKKIEVKVIRYDKDNNVIPEAQSSQNEIPILLANTARTIKKPVQFPEYHKAYNHQYKQYLLAWFMLIAQIIIATMNGLFINTSILKKLQSVIFFWNQFSLSGQNALSLSQMGILTDDFWLTMIISFASTLGFGLLFSYNKRLILQGLGFSLFINAYSIQYYPLINALVTQMRIHNSSLAGKWNQNYFYLNQSINLTNIDYTISSLVVDNYNTIQGCFRAAMAVNVAVSCILGRVGLFEIFITIIVGTFGYEINRKVCMHFGDDAFGTMYIFAFGGFMALGIGTILRMIDKSNVTVGHNFLRSDQTTSTLSLLGAIILILSLPFLAYRHYNNSYSSGNNLFLFYTPVLCVIFSACGGLISAISLPLLKGRSPKVKDFIHGPIAGMIVGGASGYFTANISYCIGMGLIGGSIQSLIENIFEPIFLRERKIFSTNSFTLFGLHGLIGCITAAFGKINISSDSRWLSYNSSAFNYNMGKLFAYGVVSAAIGFVFGLIIGLICYLVSFQVEKAYFNDRYNWIIGSNIDAKHKKLSKPKLVRDQIYFSEVEDQQSQQIISPKSVLSIPY